MQREGQIIGGKHYLNADGQWVEVTEEVYYGYMRLVWQEEKNADRRSRCVINGKRCMKDCRECQRERAGAPLSLDKMFDDYQYEPPIYSRLSVEEIVIKKLDIEALLREVGKLPYEDKRLICALYLWDEPLTQKEAAGLFGISQQAVCKRRNRILKELKEKLAAEIL